MATRKGIESSLALILFGLIFLIYSIEYPLDTWANPGPGVFPLMVATVLVILASWVLVQNLRKLKVQAGKKTHEGAKETKTEFSQRSNVEAKAVFLIAIFVIYLVMVKWVGFFISNFMFIIISSRLMGARSWGKPIALSAGINLFCYFLFVTWIKLSFPRGVLF